MGHIPVEGLMMKFMVLAMIAVDDRVVVGLAMVDFSGPLMFHRVDVPGVHRGTFSFSKMGSGSAAFVKMSVLKISVMIEADYGGCFVNDFVMVLMIVVEVARAVVVSEGVLLAVERKRLVGYIMMFNAVPCLCLNLMEKRVVFMFYVVH